MPFFNLLSQPFSDSHSALQTRLQTLSLEAQLGHEIMETANVLYGPRGKYTSFSVILGTCDTVAEVAVPGKVPEYQAKLVGFLKGGNDWELLHMGEIMQGTCAALDDSLGRLRYEFVTGTVHMVVGNKFSERKV